MDAPELDNPIWHSLQSRHRRLAQRCGGVVRYPAIIAPFLAVAAADGEVEADLAALIEGDESVYLLGVAPRLGRAWSLKPYAALAQMQCERLIDEAAVAAGAAFDAAPIIALDARHHDDVLALTARVYPHYFRPRTTELGRYFGIYEQGRLAAMIGERMGMDTCQEISAVCTDPDFAGRGLARRLLAWLSTDNLARGRLPFLHVSHDNVRAKRIYEQAGYRLRRDIGFWSLRRA